MRRGRHMVLAWLGTVWLVLAVSTGGALAHAALVVAAPADGEVVEQAPERVILRFNQPVHALAMSLVTPDGRRIDLLDRTAGGAELIVGLPAGLSTGTHLVNWRVSSADGHPIGGATAFSVNAATGGGPVPTTSSDPAVSIALWTFRLALCAGLFFGIGGAVFAALVAPLPAPARTLAMAATGGGLLAAPIALGLHGVDGLGQGLHALFSAGAWTSALSTSFGHTVAGCLLALGLAASSLRRDAPRPLLQATAALLVVAASFAASGHAAVAAPQWVARPAVFLHVAGIVFWAGALPPLALLLAKGGREATRALQRFSAVAPVPVAAVLVSGLALAAVQFGPQPRFWFSAYGAIFAAKLALLFALFGLAAWNRYGLTRPALAADRRALRHLRLSATAEAAVVLVILGLAAGWRFTPPPRAIAEAVPQPVIIHLESAALTAEVAVTPGQAGANTLAIRLTAAADAVVASELAVAFSSPSRGLEPLRRQAEPGADGVWHAAGLSIPLPGLWQVDLDIRLGRFESVRLTGSFTIPDRPPGHG